jgi:hypothetical protein
MPGTWTIGRKLAAGFAATVALAILIAGIGVYGLRRVVAEEEELISVHARPCSRRSSCRSRSSARSRRPADSSSRATTTVSLMREGRNAYLAKLARLENRVPTEEGKRRLPRSRSSRRSTRPLDRAIAALKNKEDPEKVAGTMRQVLAPGREQIYQRFEFVSFEQRQLEQAEAEASSHAAAAQALVIGAMLAVIALAVAIAVVLSKAIAHQVGSAIQQVQGSSTELRAAATQQANGARELSGAMTEIATTINGSPRRPADRRQREAGRAIAEKTADSGRSGETAMTRRSRA